MESRFEITKEPIYLYRGEENGVVIEKKDYTKSIFRNQYAQALQLIDELSAQRPRNDDKQEDDKFEPLSQPNIIAFCGDRGEGKTSCMMTVRHIIENEDTEAYKALTGYLPSVDLKVYEFLEMIEPAFFDQEHNKSLFS